MVFQKSCWNLLQESRRTRNFIEFLGTEFSQWTDHPNGNSREGKNINGHNSSFHITYQSDSVPLFFWREPLLPSLLCMAIHAQSLLGYSAHSIYSSNSRGFWPAGTYLKKKRGKLLVIGRENLRNWAHLGKDVKKSLWFKPGSPHWCWENKMLE